MKNTTRFLLVILAFPVLIWGQPKVLFEKHILVEDFTQTMSVLTTDLDGDGDQDILGAAYSGNNISCWQNMGNQKFQEHLVSSTFRGPRTVYAADLDRDGDKDILAAGYNSNSIAWWERKGSYQYVQHTITENFTGAHTVCTADLDGDKDVDIIASAWSARGIHWWENDGQQNFTEYILDEEGSQYPCVSAVDLDGDSDMDIVGCCWGSGDVFWWENDGSKSFTKHVLEDQFTFAHWVYVSDVDQDGDLDVLGASWGMNQVTWWENDGNQAFTKHVITNKLKNATSVTATDLDGDGDIDVLSAAETANEIRWYENDGSQNFTEYSLALDFEGASHVHAVDLDNDGDVDVLGAGRYVNQIAWWENINEFIIPKINFDPKSGHAPLTVQFSDLTWANPGLNSWQWDFDNDGTIDSEKQNPQWTYEKAGTYSIRIILSNDTKSEEVTLENKIRVFDGESGLFFGGDKEFAMCPDSTSLNFSEELTIEAWIKPAGWGTMPAYGFGHIIDKGNVSLYLNGVKSMFNAQSLVIFLDTAGSISGYANSPDSSIKLDEWQHVAVSYESSNSVVKMYINDTEQELTFIGEQPAGPVEDNSESNLYIGSSEVGFTFHGTIDELRIWNCIRSQEEIQTGMETRLSCEETGLVNYWKMNEGNGDSIGDCSANQNHGQLNGAIWDFGYTIPQPSAIHESGEKEFRLPDEFILYSNYPNPFNPVTTISFHLPDPSPIKLQIYDIQGRIVKRLFEKDSVPAGLHFFKWNGQDENGQKVSSGLYFYRIESDEQVAMKKMLLVK